MKRLVPIVLILTLVSTARVTYFTPNGVYLISSTDFISKDVTTQVGNFLIDENEEFISVLVYLKDQVDLDAINSQMDERGATLRDRHKTTVTALQNTASSTQPQLVQYLKELQSKKLIKDFKCYWIRNIIRVDTYQNVVDHLRLHDDVYWVYPNFEIELIAPIKENVEK